MQNVQFYIGLVLFFVGTVWALLAFGRSILERRTIRAGIAANLRLATDRHTDAKHRAERRTDSLGYAVYHRQPVSFAVSHSDRDSNRDSTASRSLRNAA